MPDNWGWVGGNIDPAQLAEMERLRLAAMQPSPQTQALVGQYPMPAPPITDNRVVAPPPSAAPAPGPIGLPQNDPATVTPLPYPVADPNWSPGGASNAGLQQGLSALGGQVSRAAAPPADNRSLPGGGGSAHRPTGQVPNYALAQAQRLRAQALMRQQMVLQAPWLQRKAQGGLLDG